MPETTTALQFTPTPDSSQIAAYAYDAGQQMMVLRFKKKGEDTDNKSYGYPGVAPEKYADFLAAESKGSWFYENLKSQYPRGVFRYLNADGSPQTEA